MLEAANEKNKTPKSVHGIAIICYFDFANRGIQIDPKLKNQNGIIIIQIVLLSYKESFHFLVISPFTFSNLLHRVFGKGRLQ